MQRNNNIDGFLNVAGAGDINMSGHPGVSEVIGGNGNIVQQKDLAQAVPGMVGAMLMVTKNVDKDLQKLGVWINPKAANATVFTIRFYPNTLAQIKKIDGVKHIERDDPNQTVQSQLKDAKMFDYLKTQQKDLAQAVEAGTLNQKQANQIAQYYYKATHLSDKEKMQKIKRSNPDKFLEQLKKSGYEYKEMPAPILPAGAIGVGMSVGELKPLYPRPYGVAVKIVKPEVASEVKPVVESKFPTWGYVAIGLLVVGAGAYYYSKNGFKNPF